MHESLFAKACEKCGLPLSTYRLVRGAPIETAAWMVKSCNVQHGFCRLRKAALKAVFAAD